MGFDILNNLVWFLISRHILRVVGATLLVDRNPLLHKTLTRHNTCIMTAVHISPFNSSAKSIIKVRNTWHLMGIFSICFLVGRQVGI